jgi:hypothetical protein
MNTYKETILQAIETAIINANIATNVFRSRYTPLSFENGEFPAIVIKRGQESIDNLNQAIAMRRFQVRIESHARGNPSDQVADILSSQVSNLLLADQTLSGTVQRVFETEVLEPEFPDGDGIQCSIPVIYTFCYATSAKDGAKLAR